jgi:hypothetical protein
MGKFIHLLGITLVMASLCGCASTVRSQNREALANLRMGMTEDQVRAVMGTEKKTVYNGSWFESIPSPYRTSAFVGPDGKTYVAWMYYTDWCQGTAGLHCLTPIVFQDGRVVGWGAEYMSTLKMDLKVH